MNFRLSNGFRGGGVGRLGLAFMVMAGAIIGASSARATDISGVWWIKDRSELAPIDHMNLPLLPDAMEAYKRNGVALATGKIAPPGNGAVPAGGDAATDAGALSVSDSATAEPGDDHP